MASGTHEYIVIPSRQSCGGVGLREGMSEEFHEMCHALCTDAVVASRMLSMQACPG